MISQALTNTNDEKYYSVFRYDDEIIADRDYLTLLTYDEGVRVTEPHFRFLFQGDSKQIVVDFGSNNGKDMLLLRQIYDEYKEKENNKSHKTI